MASPPWREQLLMLLTTIPMAGTTDVMIAQMVTVILELWNCAHVQAYLTLAMGVSLVSLWRLMCNTQ